MGSIVRALALFQQNKKTSDLLPTTASSLRCDGSVCSTQAPIQSHAHAMSTCVCVNTALFMLYLVPISQTQETACIHSSVLVLLFHASVLSRKVQLQNVIRHY